MRAALKRTYLGKEVDMSKIVVKESVFKDALKRFKETSLDLVPFAKQEKVLYKPSVNKQKKAK